ncbi:bifunctional oligoribonuclease/PAP phosphatase NrnA [Spiroplasma endosymbiont of Aspidapion aeneum]|uniref:DHH family phosphoesterase n=1 Tax=Spiroplasma endosymbiont of Aspidapion aeneum TaxID=3066276 RepID=UPI00313B85A8
MDNKRKIIIKKIIDEIKKEQNIIILRHILPDGDAYGFQFGLKRLINLNWPEKNVKIIGKPNPKLSYIGNKFDNITDEEFKNSLVIVGDAANTARIDDSRWNIGKKVIKIDHHPDREPYGDISLVCDDYCAVSEILGDIIMDNNLNIDSEIARILYHGIVTDSLRFLVRYPKARTFKIAAFLLEQGFNLQELYKNTYTKSKSELKLISYVYDNYETTKHGVTYLRLDKNMLEKLNVDADFAAYNNVSLLSDIEGTKIWAFFCEYADKQAIRVELRSMDIVINKVAYAHGGGGHNTSAGAMVKTWEEVQVIINELDLIAKSAS